MLNYLVINHLNLFSFFRYSFQFQYPKRVISFLCCAISRWFFSLLLLLRPMSYHFAHSFLFLLLLLHFITIRMCGQVAQPISLAYRYRGRERESTLYVHVGIKLRHSLNIFGIMIHESSFKHIKSMSRQDIQLTHTQRITAQIETATKPGVEHSSAAAVTTTASSSFSFCSYCCRNCYYFTSVGVCLFCLLHFLFRRFAMHAVSISRNGKCKILHFI